VPRGHCPPRPDRRPGVILPVRGSNQQVHWRRMDFRTERLRSLPHPTRAGRTLPAGEGGCAAGSLCPSHYPKLGPAVRCRSSPEFPFRFIWVLGWSTRYLCANDPTPCELGSWVGQAARADSEKPDDALGSWVGWAVWAGFLSEQFVETHAPDRKESEKGIPRSTSRLTGHV
jgi:hypothetical protein